MDPEDVSFGGKFGALTAFLEDLVLTQHLNPQNNQEGAGFGESLGSDFYNINNWNIEIFGFNQRFIRDFKVTQRKLFVHPKVTFKRNSWAQNLHILDRK